MRNDNSLPLKTLVILDKDNCELDTLEVFGALEDTLEQIAANRNLNLELLHILTREANGEHRFNDALRLIDHMNEVEPLFQTGNEAHSEGDARAKMDWLKRTASLSQFYPDVLDTLKKWHALGTNVVTKTDAERLPIIRRVWLTAFNAYNNHELKSPYEIISLYDHIYCKPSLHEPEHAEDFDDYLRDFCHDNNVPFPFARALNRHITVLREEYKPCRDHMQIVHKDFPASPEQILYIGDTYKDGMEARLLDPKVDFAWASYGADWSPRVRDFYAKVGSNQYSYGRDVALQRLEQTQVHVSATLETSMADIFNHFSFGHTNDGREKRRSLADARAQERAVPFREEDFHHSFPG